MKYSALFGKTLRDIPREVKSATHILLLKGGYVRSLGHGLYSLLPLGQRVFRNIRKIIRDELDLLGGQEVQVPIVNPGKIWRRSGRMDIIDRDMINFRDRSGKLFVLSPSHEEAMVELVRRSLGSYRDLPIFLYQFQEKYRDEGKIKYGLISAKEFLMSDAYSFHRSFSELNNFFPKLFAAYEKIFKKCGIDVLSAVSGAGYMGGDKAYEFFMPSTEGENVIIQCPNCGYTANGEIAKGIKEFSSLENPLPVEEIVTPECTTMDKLSRFLNVPKTILVKSMVYKYSKGLVMALVRGDYEISLEKLSRFLDYPVRHRASSKDLEANGLVSGYLSPLGINENITVVVDDIIAKTANLVMGGNKEEIHFRNINFGRDFESEYVGDIVRMKEGNKCLQCGDPLKEICAVELGNIFKLGDYYSKSMELFFYNDNGKKVFPHMGSYGIGIGRLMASVVYASSDDKGIIWPVSIAPYKIFLMGIAKAHSVKEAVERIYLELGSMVLLDDRNESPGVKFKDADLMGIPYRIVVSASNLQNNEVEFYERKSGKTWRVPIPDLKKEVENLGY